MIPSYPIARSQIIVRRVPLRPSHYIGRLAVYAWVIHIRRSRLHRPSGVELGETKTPHSLRSVEMPSRVAEILHTHSVAQAQERLASTHWSDWNLAFADGAAFH